MQKTIRLELTKAQITELLLTNYGCWEENGNSISDELYDILNRKFKELNEYDFRDYWTRL